MLSVNHWQVYCVSKVSIVSVIASENNKATRTKKYLWKCIDCTESGLQMFKDAVEEFYRCLLEKVNQVVAADGKDVNVSW